MSAQPERSDQNDHESSERSQQEFDDVYQWLRNTLRVLRIKPDEPVQLSLQLDAVPSPLQLEFRAVQAEKEVRELKKELTDERNTRIKVEEELRAEREEVGYEPSYQDESARNTYDRHLEARREYGMVRD